jgi:hypothetical protein
MTIVEAASIKSPGVAGAFYPGEADALARMVDQCLERARPLALAPKAIIAPHAGYVFSGPIAGTAYRTAAARRPEIRRVIILGPCHRVPVRSMAVPGADAFATPLGPVEIDRAARETALKLAGVEVFDDAFAEEHSLEVQLPFLQRTLERFTVLPVLVGAAPADTVAALLKALWGGPETLIVISSDLSHYHDYAKAQASDAEAAKAIELLQPEQLKSEQACGRHGIRGLLTVARALDLRTTTIDLRNSGDTRGGRDRVVGYGAFAFEYAQTARLGEPERKVLLDGAKWSIEFGLKNGREPTAALGQGMARPLMAMRACFVTLTLDGKLRGCIGSLQAHRPLILDVIGNAYRAAFGDHRFQPLTSAEHQRLHVEISVLSTPRPIPCTSEAELLRELRPDVDGLIIRDGKAGAVFLPQVWHGVPRAEQFLGQLRRKAGLAPNHWSDSFRAFRFTTEGFEPRVQHQPSQPEA